MRPSKFARVTFPEAEGYRCDFREVGPQGFSLPWSGVPATMGAANIISEAGPLPADPEVPQGRGKAVQKWATGEVLGGHYR